MPLIILNQTSELGEELRQLQFRNSEYILDPTGVKNILVTTEDTRIATRISEVIADTNDLNEVEHRTQNIESLRLNLISGQQCVRDFFLCMNENLLSWPDVFFGFSFKITHSTKCCYCNHVNQFETTQMYVELQVPPDNSKLSDHMEEHFNLSSMVGKFCENKCQRFVESEKRSTITSIADTEFIPVILTRAVETMDGFKLSRKKTISTNEVCIR